MKTMNTLLSGKIVVMSRRIDMFLLCLMLLIAYIKPFFGVGYILYFLIFFLFLMILFFILMKGTYSVVNTKASSLIPVVTHILDEKDIRYKLEDLCIELTGYEDSKITFRQSFNSVEVNFRSIQKQPFYQDLIKNTKMQAKQISEKVFPASGVFYVITGIILMCLFAIMLSIHRF